LIDEREREVVRGGERRGEEREVSARWICRKILCYIK
jgi:hypothetical protein